MFIRNACKKYDHFCIKYGFIFAISYRDPCLIVIYTLSTSCLTSCNCKDDNTSSNLDREVDLLKTEVTINTLSLELQE